MSTRKRRKAPKDAQDEQGASIRQRLEILKEIAPHKTGLHLYRTQEQKRTATTAATLFIYIRSHDNTYALHETFFRSRKRARTPIEWEHYFRSVVLHGTGSDEDEPAIREGVMKGAIIPGINLRTQRLWDVRAVIGFITHDIRVAKRPAISTRRHKTKSQGKQDGQTNLRRRYRNGTRKAK